MNRKALSHLLNLMLSTAALTRSEALPASRRQVEKDLEFVFNAVCKAVSKPIVPDLRPRGVVVMVDHLRYDLR